MARATDVPTEVPMEAPADTRAPISSEPARDRDDTVSQSAARPKHRRRRPGLAGRAALVTTAVAVVAVLITGLVSAGLVRSAAENEARRTLGRYADLVSQQDPSITPQAVLRARRAVPAVVRVFNRVQITVAIVTPTGSIAGRARVPVLVTVASQAASGQRIDEVDRVGGRSLIIEGRPLPQGGDLVLVQPLNVATSEVSQPLKIRLVIALLIGLAVAALAGVLLARWLARPLRHAVTAARRLAAGQRDVVIEPKGPAEVAGVADSLNALAGALATSEGRQREFLLSVSHELRTPLTAVKGYAEALADGVVPPEDVRPTGATMLAEAGRLDRLVADLLDLARLGADDFRLDFTPVDLTDLVRQAGRVWESRTRREGVVLRVEDPGRPLEVISDATRVRQILDGLTENALRVTPSGAPIVLAVHESGTDAVLEVRDGGPGLTDEDIAVAFERSALYDRYRGVRRVGTGVGLALVAGLTARLGGRAEAGHAAEGGARFAVRLPMGRPTQIAW